MHCVHCGESLYDEDMSDTTSSNTSTERAHPGQHTGDIYTCPHCDGLTIDDFLTGELRPWAY